LSNILIVAISVDLPVAVDNPVPASEVGFQQFRAIERFCVEGSNKRSDRGTLQLWFRVFYWQYFQSVIFEFSQIG